MCMLLMNSSYRFSWIILVLCGLAFRCMVQRTNWWMNYKNSTSKMPVMVGDADYTMKVGLTVQLRVIIDNAATS